MSWLLVVLALAACDDHGKSPPAPCGDVDCNAAQLCLVPANLIDGGVQLPQQCVAIPDGCPITDCFNTTCPTCILDLCDGMVGGEVVLQTRRLACRGP